MKDTLAAEIKVREIAARKAIQPVMTPSMPLLCKLGSIIVHAEELAAPGGHNFDRIALEGLVNDPEVVAWMAGMRDAAFLPVKRTDVTR